LAASSTTAPKHWLLPLRIWWAAELRTNPSRSITSSTRSRVAGATRSGRFSTLDAVPSDTPACSATSRIVIRPTAAGRVIRAARAGLAGGFVASLRRGVNGFLPWVLTQDARPTLADAWSEE